jgi:hypothetical protein
MLTHQAFYQNELRKNLLERIEVAKDNLVTSHTAIEYADYKFRVGVIHGLQAALEACEEVESELNKR